MYMSLHQLPVSTYNCMMPVYADRQDTLVNKICDKVLNCHCGVSRDGMAPGADLGGGSKHSNENFEQLLTKQGRL